MSTSYGYAGGVHLTKYAGPESDAVTYNGQRTRVRYQIDTHGGGQITLDPIELDGLRELLGRLDDDQAAGDPLADYRPVYLTDGGVTDEAALLDRVLFVLLKVAMRR